MGSTEIITLVTFFVTMIFGFFAKKSTFIKNELIPLQNLAIGIIVAGIEWIITKDLDAAILLSGIMAGGVYDIFNNTKKIVANTVTKKNK